MGNGHLVITRTVGQSVIINNELKITVIQAKGRTIRLSFEGEQKKFHVAREELFLKAKHSSPHAVDCQCKFCVPNFGPGAAEALAKENLLPGERPEPKLPMFDNPKLPIEDQIRQDAIARSRKTGI